MSATERLGPAQEACDMNAARMGYYAEIVEKVVQELEAENRELRAKLETVSEALTGAQNIVRELRDRDSDLHPEMDPYRRRSM